MYVLLRGKIRNIERKNKYACQISCQLCSYNPMNNLVKLVVLSQLYR